MRGGKPGKAVLLQTPVALLQALSALPGVTVVASPVLGCVGTFRLWARVGATVGSGLQPGKQAVRLDQNHA